jgi:hypothetical protein
MDRLERIENKVDALLEKVDAIAAKLDDPNVEVMTFKDSQIEVLAALLKAYWDLASEDDLKSEYLQQGRYGREYIFMADIRKRANLLLDKKLSPQAVGNLVRDVLDLEVGKRQGKGVPVYFDREHALELAAHYGFDMNK